MALMDLLSQLEEIDVTKGYGEGGNNLSDGTYNGYCEDFIYTDKQEKGGLFTIKLKTIAQESYGFFININEKTIKFNLQNMMTSIYRISGENLDYTALQTNAITQPEIFVESMKSLIVGKECTFTLKTNKNGYQTCQIEDSTMPF
ncbi:hypothetical protein [Streptobacillus moniliformis]|uniref:hypothetical protein n=1 Tax=Streptobacillus moniliformis TaxID=34105 RepID=UPI0007E45755|nr:hypothetical protein [Streptobacillus moniliformis]